MPPFKKNLTRAVAVLALTVVAGTAAASDRWLHVRVESHDSRGDNVSVNVPLGLIEAILPTINIDEFRHGKLHLDEIDLEGFDLREVLSALRDAPDADFVRVTNDDETVRVAKEDGYLVVRVDEQRGDKVRLKIPLEVIEAMLGGDDNELDLMAGLRVLSDFQEDVLVVESDNQSVRVWIDSNSDGE